jgi:CRP/FNR family transcriptional regulator, cyclic AMP receptor protein
MLGPVAGLLLNGHHVDVGSTCQECGMDQEQRARMLAASRLFGEVPTPAIQRLAAAAGLHRYRRGQILFVEGDSGDSLLLIVDGTLKAYSTSAEGEEFLLAVVGPGETLGELTLADGGSRSASVAALTDASVLPLPRQAVVDVGAIWPQVTSALLKSLADVVRRLTGAAADLVFLDLPRRVAKLLLIEREAAHSDVFKTRLNQEEMAQRVGASRQSVNTALREFQRRGWIAVEGHRIHVHQPQEIQRFIGE